MKVKIFSNYQELLEKKARNQGLKGKLDKVTGEYGPYWSNYRFSKLLGVSETQLRNLKTKVRQPEVSVLMRLGEIAYDELGIAPAEFWAEVKKEIKL